MGFASFYLNKYSLFKPFIVPGPEPDTGLIVVIPSFSEPDILTSLESLYSADRPSFPVEIIIVVNAPDEAGEHLLEENRRTVLQVRQWSEKKCSPSFRVHVVDTLPFPSRHAGAGLARKTGMDEALRRFNLLKNEGGIIVSFDADSKCDSNYFTELERCFSDNQVIGCTVYFEHPLSGDDQPPVVYDAVAGYELYLRYFIQAMRLTGFPWAFHTLGSCFAVRAKVYASMGGMNRKKAGEDFYFLHKIFPLGGFTEVNTTRVIPSSRVSGRAPFGTGAAIKKYASGDRSMLNTYSVSSFDDLSVLFSAISGLFNATENQVTIVATGLPGCLADYLNINGFSGAVKEMNIHSASLQTFRKRFFVWFNALRLLKFLNFARENCYPDQPLTLVAEELLRRTGEVHGTDCARLLAGFRKLQRGIIWRC
jgi:hypothetical protein